MKAKQEIKTGFKWSFIGFFVQKGLTLITGVILARLLSPEEFGLLGMANVFLALFQVFVDSGFGYTIIRTKDLNARLINTSFSLNIVIGVITFIFFYFSAQIISDFFNAPNLVPVIQLLSVVIIINSLRIVPLNINVRELKFKERARIDILANIIGGIVGITLAFLDYGVLSLVWQMIISSAVTTFAHNFVAKISYKIEIHIDEVKTIYKTSHRILFNQILSTIFNNLNNIVIGRYYTAGDLGFYNRAKSFQKLVQNSTVQMTQRAIFPVFSKIDSLTETYIITRETVRKLSLLAMPIILFVGAIADNFIIVLLTDKWAESINYLVLLTIYSSLFVPQMVFINVLKANDDKLFFRSEYISKIIRLTLLIVAVPFGISAIIISQIVQVFIVNFISGHLLNKFLKEYTIKNQIRDYAMPLFSSFLIAGLVYVLGVIMPFGHLIELIIQCLLFVFLFLAFLKLNKINVLKLIK